MPRTKGVNESRIKEANKLLIFEPIKKLLEINRDEELEKNEQNINRLLEQIDEINSFMLSVPIKYMNMTLNEIRLPVKNTILDAVSKISDKTDTKRTKDRPVKKSNEEGPVKRRKLEFKGKTQPQKRHISTSKEVKNPPKRLVVPSSKAKGNLPIRHQFKTPLNRAPPKAAAGLVTPRIKPGEPQVVLRRPKRGEVAISLSGSPLKTNIDQRANLNIPLKGGDLVSIQPVRGLRQSQIPIIDDVTREQLAALRDNINQMLGSFH